MVEVLDNCQLEWDKVRGVLYVHIKDTGATVLRICRLQKADAAHILGDLANGQIDITGPFERISYPTGLGIEEPIFPGPYLWSALRKMGFVRCDVTNFNNADVRVFTYRKQVDARRSIDVQIWSDGGHRASSAFRGCSDTKPTEFSTLEGMRRAIDIEGTRMDGKYSRPGSLSSEGFVDLEVGKE